MHKAYLEWEHNEHTVDRWYWAQIAAEIRKTRVKNPRKIKTSDLLIKFEVSKALDKPQTEEQKQARLKQSKGFWSALMKREGRRNIPGPKRRGK